MNSIVNFDLLTVGITTAAIIILGFVIFFNNPKSITNRSFLFLSLTASLYNILNYISYQPKEDYVVLAIIRLVIFSALWYAYSLFQLIFVIPLEIIRFPKWYKFILLPAVVCVSLLNLTPYVFQSLSSTVVVNQVTKFKVGPGVLFFISLSIFLVFGSLVFLIIKTYKSIGVQKKQFLLILLGSILTFSLIIIFNLILPTVLQNVSFIKFAPLFVFPFITFTAYAILKHKLFNIKIAGTALLTFALTVATFLEIIFSTDLYQIIFRSGVFILVLIFSVLLLKGVLNEVHQREQIQELAKGLEKANARLKELDQVKTEFISLATHQIRAPLTAIKGYISMILEGDYGPVSKEVTGALDITRQSADNLVVIVGDFLDVSRIEQGRMKYDFKNFDLQKLVSQVVAEYEPNIQKKQLGVQYSFDQGKDYSVYADEGKIKQVIGNMIDNSIKYTPKGHLEIHIGRQDEKILVKISDTGLGISPEIMPKLFQKFSRAQNASEANILGTGLGLYVARQLVEANKGRVWAESEGEGKGSQFYIELPAKG